MSKHADIVNEQYNHKESNFVSLQTRITEAFKLAPKFEAQLEAVVEEFKRRNKDNWSSYSDMELVQAIPVDFSKILIDSTMQRPVNMRHVLKILNYFSQTMVMPIQVYKEGDNYIAWTDNILVLHFILYLQKYLVNVK